MTNVKPNDHKLVLVVDDDRDVRESMSQLLDAKGYSTVQAENGQRALEILKHTPHLPCIIVLDLAMPVMDGYGFLRLRAQDPTLREVPVVITSANLRAEPALKQKIDAYLAKPVNLDRLFDVIDQYC